MITTLNALQIVLETLLVVCVLAILVIGADFVYFEFQQMVTRNRAWDEKARKMIYVARHEAANVDALIADSTAELKKAKLRHEKEIEAWNDYLAGDYFRGFDEDGFLIYRGASAPCDPDWEFFTEIDKIADAAIFTNTEDLS